MKKLSLFSAILVFTLALFSAPPAKAGFLIGNLSPVTTATTNSPTFLTNTAYIPLPQITVYNNALSTNTAYSGYFRWSFDNVTFYTNASPTFTPSTTNAGQASIAQQGVQVPIYIQVGAITNSASTSAIQLGISTP
jgi:hypothetical protein